MMDDYSDLKPLLVEIKLKLADAIAIAKREDADHDLKTELECMEETAGDLLSYIVDIIE
jgi:hypothetical protein